MKFRHAEGGQGYAENRIQPPGHPPTRSTCAVSPPVFFICSILLCGVPPSVLEFCAVSPPKFEHLTTISCAVSPQFWAICGVMSSNISFQILCGVPTPLRTSDEITISWMCGVPAPYIWNLTQSPPLIYLICLAVNLAQLVSTSVALPAELVFTFSVKLKAFTMFRIAPWTSWNFLLSYCVK